LVGSAVIRGKKLSCVASGSLLEEAGRVDSTRLREEAKFADQAYAQMAGDLSLSERQFSKYRDPHQMWDWRQRGARLLGDLQGKRLLDYGCGMGEETLYFAKLGARVSAIDISQEGVETTRKRASRHGVADRVEARVMDALHTDFPDESFDLVHGLGILHHIDLVAGLAEIHRVLRSGGSAVFLEPLGNSPIVESLKWKVYRKFKHKFDLLSVTSGEENLKLGVLHRQCERFSHHHIYPYRLIYRVRKLFLPRSLWNMTLRVDRVLLSMVPPLKHFAGAAVIHLTK
jgi:ubiquinone/menaquinone biosynthesis C-methylase UbiE